MRQTENFCFTGKYGRVACFLRKNIVRLRTVFYEDFMIYSNHSSDILRIIWIRVIADETIFKRSKVGVFSLQSVRSSGCNLRVILSLSAVLCDRPLWFTESKGFDFYLSFLYFQYPFHYPFHYCGGVCQ